MEIVDFWGKAQPLDANQGLQWHPLVFHCLDVAAVGTALLDSHSKLADHLSRLLGLQRQDTICLVPFLLCLHDIGKFAKKFQAKAPRHYPSCFGDDPNRVPTSFDHGAGGLRLFDADHSILALQGVSQPIWRPLISAVTGHHGVPPISPTNAGRESLRILRTDFGMSGIDAACLFANRMKDLLTPPIDLPKLNRKQVLRGSFAIAGLCVLSDWIGSNQKWFRYCASAEYQGLEEYWVYALEQAKQAIIETGVLPAGVRGQLKCNSLIGAKGVPTPMQTWAHSVELPTGPTLFMIEDETGSGKTEAALMIAHRLMAAGRADGLYVALPTMATANAMFDRLGDACRTLFALDANPSVALTHGARDLHPSFRSVQLTVGHAEAPYSGTSARDTDAETTATTACAAWVADDRRLAFLADAGAGTVDQALLSVLPSRHQSLRLLGLMRRVLILDEVHAYDTYMQREIDAMLEFQAGLGGSAILLSATLPATIHRRMTQAFVRGLDNLGETANCANDTTGYPLATVCASDVRHSKRILGQSGRGRRLPVRFLGSCQEALSAVTHAADAGKSVVYIRNTVDDAIEAFKLLAERRPPPLLFHARCALVDRLSREKEVLQTFGKWSCSSERSGRILVATQVVEQSLDLDFDAMITDLAPIDLMIQRAGRLWRHNHRKRDGNPELLVVAPKTDNDDDQCWFRREFPRAAYVYRDHARLWLTAKALREAGAIESPEGLRALIESVYGDGSEEQVPERLRGVYWEAEGQARADRSVAGMNVLKLARGYVRDAGNWDVDIRTQTRLADDPHTTLRLAFFRGGQVVPYAKDAAPYDLQRAWRLSEVSVSKRRVGGEDIPEHLTKAARDARKDWSRFDSDKILVLLEEAEEMRSSFYGRVFSGDEARIKIGYDMDLGLTWEST